MQNSELYDTKEMLKTITEKQLPIMQFVLTEKDPEQVKHDLAISPKLNRNFVRRMFKYIDQDYPDFIKTVKEGINYRQKQISYAKRNCTKPFVGQILHVVWGYDATINDFYKVTKVTKCFVWLYNINDDSKKIMRRKIQWDQDGTYFVAINSYTTADPYNGEKVEDDYND